MSRKKVYIHYNNKVNKDCFISLNFNKILTIQDDITRYIKVYLMIVSETLIGS